MVKKIISTFLALTSFCYSSYAQAWVKHEVSEYVHVYFPVQAEKSDTLGQSIYFYQEGKDYMLATAAPIPDSILLKDNYSTDSILDNFIQSVTVGSNFLIYNDLEYKEQPAKFYKVRVDDDANPIRGLIADSYNFIYKNTIYSISYLRYDASELFNYNNQRKFFDMVEIVNQQDSMSPVDSLKEITAENETHKKTSTKAQSKRTYWIALILAIALGAWFFQHKIKKE